MVHSADIDAGEDSRYVDLALRVLEEARKECDWGYMLIRNEDAEFWCEVASISYDAFREHSLDYFVAEIKKEVEEDMRLYELTGMYLRLVNMDEVGIDVDAALETVKEDFATKAENAAKVIRSLEAESKVYEAEADRMSRAASAIENRIGNIKDYLRANMEALKLEETKGQLLKTRLQLSTPACQVVDESLVPKKFRELVTTIKIDKKAIITLWKSGKMTKGTVVTQGKYIKIYP